MLKLQSINKRLGTFQLTDISLEIETGEYFVLLGPSGVGKTVLLEIIAGLIRPDVGKIFRHGTDITCYPPEKRSFAVVYQDYALFPHLSVERNITYGLRIAGETGDSIKKRLQTLAEMLDISSLLKRKPATLSGGQQQRVALARALATEPGMLLLDEPLSALDTNIRQRLQTKLKQINRELNTTIVHVTHDPQEAMVLADRICVMLDGRVWQIASPEELFRRPSDASVAEFLGMSNVFIVSGAKDGACLTHGQRIHVSSTDDSIRHIWIRPEEIILSKAPFDSSALNQFKCTVAGWDHRDSLLAVRITCGELELTALITHTSFSKLEVAPGTELYATFKSSAVHCF